MKTILTLGTSLALAVTAMLAWSDTDKPLPGLPLTVEGIVRFAEPKDLELLNSTSYYSKQPKEYIYRNSAILEEYEPKYNVDGLESWLYPGVVVNYRDRISSDTWTTGKLIVPGSVSPTWTQDGKIYYENFMEVTKADVELINQLDSLAILEIMNTVERPFDINWFSPELPLKAFHIHAPEIVNPSSVCQYPNLQFIRYISSGLKGEFNTSGCSAELETLFVTHSDVENLTVTQLPALSTLNLFGSDIEKFQLEGESLPNLKSILLGEAELPSDLSEVHLPEGLVQVLMPRVTDNDLAQLQLPENLQYLRLPEAQLDDYSFITRAKHLKHLQLAGSNFNQWALLSELTELEHLGLAGTDVDDDVLPILAGLTQLQSLDLGATRITTAEPLKALQSLNSLNLYDTDIRDLNTIPFIEHIGYLGLPTVEAYQSPRLPEHIQTMLETVQLDGYHCTGHKPCSLPAWERE